MQNSRQENPAPVQRPPVPLLRLGHFIEIRLRKPSINIGLGIPLVDHGIPQPFCDKPFPAGCRASLPLPDGPSGSLISHSGAARPGVGLSQTAKAIRTASIPSWRSLSSRPSPTIPRMLARSRDTYGLTARPIGGEKVTPTRSPWGEGLGRGGPSGTRQRAGCPRASRRKRLRARY
jgi:hypothetical protein